MEGSLVWEEFVKKQQENLCKLLKIELDSDPARHDSGSSEACTSHMTSSWSVASGFQTCGLTIGSEKHTRKVVGLLPDLHRRSLPRQPLHITRYLQNRCHLVDIQTWMRLINEWWLIFCFSLVPFLFPARRFGPEANMSLRSSTFYTT